MTEINEGGRIAAASVVQKSDQVGRAEVRAPYTDSHKNKVFPDNVFLPSADIDFAARQTRNDHLNTVATTIRAANKIMDSVAKVIGEKREEVLQYEKQYPPFQNQSSEKIEFLNSITALKKQVDALTLIPDNKELALVVSFSDRQKESLPDEERSQFQLRPQEVHSGENGLNIASINSNATNVEIQQYGRDLASTVQKLADKRAGLAEDAKTVSYEISIQEKNMGKEMLESEQEATQKSEEVKRNLTALPRQSLGNERGQALLETLR